MGERVYIFKGFERFWHWSQAALIIFMLLTGFEIHGTYSLFGFSKAVSYHSFAAWSLIGLWIFAIFWHLTTGEWRHYIPTTDKVLVVAQVLFFGNFQARTASVQTQFAQQAQSTAAVNVSRGVAVRQPADPGSPAGSTSSTAIGWLGV